MGLPWLNVSEFFDDHCDEYIGRHLKVSTSGEWNEWLEFCLLATIEQCRSSITRINRLLGIKKRLEDPLDPRSRVFSLIDRLFSDGMVRVVDIQREFEISYNTARAYLAELEKHGIIVELPEIYPKTFMAKEVFEAAYGD